MHKERTKHINREIKHIYITNSIPTDIHKQIKTETIKNK